MRLVVPEVPPHAFVHICQHHGSLDEVRVSMEMTSEVPRSETRSITKSLRKLAMRCIFRRTFAALEPAIYLN